MNIKKEYLIAVFFLFIISMTGISVLYKCHHPINATFQKYNQIKLDENDDLDFFEKLKKGTKACETVIEENIMKKPIIEINGLYHNMAGKRAVEDLAYGEVYKTKDKQIIYAACRKDEEVKGCSEKTVLLSNYVKNCGIPFMYVQAPFKLSFHKNQLPRTKKDFSDENVDQFLGLLEKGNVDYLDLRPLLFSKGKRGKDLFFNTDHHWNIETAFEATGLIEEHINKTYGFAINEKYRDMDNFKKTEYKNCFLGSMGRRTGALYAGLDDFSLITPRFETDMVLAEINDKENPVLKRGTFEEAILEMEYLKNNYNFYKNRYEVYHGDDRELVFTNNNVEKGNILIIKDSFGVPVYSFMSLGVHQIRALDLRLFKDSVFEYIEKYKPDLVLVLYNGDSFSNQMFDFH